MKIFQSTNTQGNKEIALSVFFYFILQLTTHQSYCNIKYISNITGVVL